MSLSAIRSSLRLANLMTGHKTLFSNAVPKTLAVGHKSTRTISRSLFYMSKNRDSGTLGPFTTKVPLSNACSCGCSVHTQRGDEELAAFLADEIENEKKARVSEELPTLEGFTTSVKQSEIIFSKKINNEVITIRSNVNDSVDAEDTVVDPNEKEPQDAEMKAKPEFTIEIAKGKKVLAFHCTYSLADGEPEGEAYTDAFQISEVSLYEGESDDSTYYVSGEIMDGYLYDLLMNYLEDRGISNTCAENMIKIFTAYEHKLYIKLLQDMKSFVEKH